MPEIFGFRDLPMDALSAAVIGVGRIGSMSDAPFTSTDRSLTHLGAVLRSRMFDSVFAVDSDVARLERAADQWSNYQLRTCSNMSEVGPLDVAAICTPSDVRLDTVKQCLERGVRVLVIEKPLALTMAEATTIVDLCEEANVTLRVNFHRRFAPEFCRIRAMLPESIPRMVVMRYGKGLYNYASHHVDLLMDWFGEVASVQAISGEAGNGDPTLSFRCQMRSGFDAFILGMDGLNYDQFEVDIYYCDHRIELSAGGVEMRKYLPILGLYYPEYCHLGTPEVLSCGRRISGFDELYLAIGEYLSDRAPLPGCSGEEALWGLRILDAARTSARTGAVEMLEGRQ